MSARAERGYRLLLRAYPPSVRADRGEEILATLAEATPPGRHLPAARESAALVVGGLRARARLAVAEGPARVWADGLLLGALLLTLTNVAATYPGAPDAWLFWLPLLLAGSVALLLARLGPALVLLAVAAAVASWPSALPLPEPLATWTMAFGGWDRIASFSLPAILVGVLALTPLRAHVRRRSLWWLLLPAAQLAVVRAAVELGGALPEPGDRVAELASAVWVIAEMLPVPALVVVALGFAAVARDPRPAVAAVALSLPGIALTVQFWTILDAFTIGYWLTITAGLLLAVGAALRAHRRQRTEL
jgi:hypothetical protein